ncbi:hypothetical protein GCM10020254_16070 [Streptomyces goshikiensis]
MSVPSVSTRAGLVEMATALAEGAVSARQLTEDALVRIQAAQHSLNAFRIVRAEAALAEADAADRRLAAGERLPLLGVPLAVKDDMDVAGEPTSFGCAGEFPPKSADSEAVRRLRAAGAVVLGKTQTPELGQWPFTEGPAFGDTRNPWNPDYTPGGSSGGSAAAVAAGLVPAALGSDGAGSVRIPAAWTHLVGVKPQRGRISTWPEPESFHGLTVNGVLARTVADAALLLDAAGGPDPGDLHRPPQVSAVEAARRTPRRLRIALSFGMAFTATAKSLDPVVRSAVERLAGRLEALGHEVVPEDPRYGPIGLTFTPGPPRAYGTSRPGCRTAPCWTPARGRRCVRGACWAGCRCGSPAGRREHCTAGSGRSSAASTWSSRRRRPHHRCASGPWPDSERWTPTGR